MMTKLTYIIRKSSRIVDSHQWMLLKPCLQRVQKGNHLDLSGYTHEMQVTQNRPDAIWVMKYLLATRRGYR